MTLEHERVRRSALNLLARREHSVHELKRKLLSKGYGQAIVGDVVQSLITAGLQSNQRFAESYVRSRINRGFGPLQIIVELQKRQIEDTLIEQIICSYDEEWQKQLEKLWLKKFGAVKPSKDLQQRMKQIRFLQQRGFNKSQIKEFINQVTIEYKYDQ